MVPPSFSFFLLSEDSVWIKLKIMMDVWMGSRTLHVLKSGELAASNIYTYLNVNSVSIVFFFHQKHVKP